MNFKGNLFGHIYDYDIEIFKCILLWHINLLICLLLLIIQVETDHIAYNKNNILFMLTLIIIFSNSAPVKPSVLSARDSKKLSDSTPNFLVLSCDEKKYGDI